MQEEEVTNPIKVGVAVGELSCFNTVKRDCSNMPDVTRMQRVHSPLNRGSDSSIGKHRGLSGSRRSLHSDTSIENKFWNQGNKGGSHQSETLILKPFGKMPEWMTTQGMEHQRRSRSIPDFLSGGSYGYPHAVYEAAAEIYERLAIRKTIEETLVQYPPLHEEQPPPTFANKRLKRQAYELAYESLKYQELLEEILIDSGFFFHHPTSEDMSALIVVMLFDFQNRKWAPRCRIIGEEVSEEVSQVEHSLTNHRVRLAAALARCRIKNQSLTIDYILPEDVREQEKCAASLPQYAWINTTKSSAVEVIEVLEENLYIEYIDSQLLLPERGKYYRHDMHCENVLIFPPDQKEVLKCLDIVEKGMLVLQDKTSSLAVKSVATLLMEDDECDLIHTDVASGLTTAHLATVLYRMTKKSRESRQLIYGKPVPNATKSIESESQQPTVYAFGIRDEAHRAQLDDLMKNMGMTNVALMTEKFEDIDPKQDARFANVKIILVTPQCTRTAVANPIDFMLNEGDKESYDALRDLSLGEKHKKAVDFGRKHVETVKSALKFSNVQAVVYVTRSVHAHENENVVNVAIRWHRELADGTKPFRVCPPTLPLLSDDLKVAETKETRKLSTDNAKNNSQKNPLKQNFLRMRQSAHMNGCFIAVISREIDRNDSAAVKDILRRAALKGLITPDKKKTSTSSKSAELKEELSDKDSPTKLKRERSKIGFGKKVRGPHTPIVLAKPRKSSLQTVEAVDIRRMLNPPRSPHAPQGSHALHGSHSPHSPHALHNAHSPHSPNALHGPSDLHSPNGLHSPSAPHSPNRPRSPLPFDAPPVKTRPVVPLTLAPHGNININFDGFPTNEPSTSHPHHPHPHPHHPHPHHPHHPNALHPHNPHHHRQKHETDHSNHHQS